MVVSTLAERHHMHELVRSMSGAVILLSKGFRSRDYLLFMGIPPVLLDALPHTHEWWDVSVDVQEVSVGVRLQHALSLGHEVEAWLAPRRAWLAEGPSLPQLQAELGSSLLDALRFAALGHVLGHWTVLSPENLSVPREEQRMAMQLGEVVLLPTPEYAQTS